MKLNIVPARTGLVWLKLGVSTFFKQPLALSGLFFMYMALISVATIVPFVGSALALTLLPAATLGLMAATREATGGKFPMPTILISAFRAGRQQAGAMLTLGALYAAGFLAIMGISTLLDGGKFARLYLLGGKITEELITASDFQNAMWVSTALYLPLSMLFWHAPALVHWHGVSPVKSLFFSLVACLRNFGAFTVYGLGWLGLFITGALAVMLVAGLIGSADLAAAAMVPLMLLMASMFFTSMYFTVRDCFIEEEPSAS
ncbi:MAG TPA: BPSS1780 family membrane protein [Burkholderiaceae bacterium]|nr:BPSS1780 family membrane protein [Burkholderiaceae bacterium]